MFYIYSYPYSMRTYSLKLLLLLIYFNSKLLMYRTVRMVDLTTAFASIKHIIQTVSTSSSTPCCVWNFFDRKLCAELSAFIVSLAQLIKLQKWRRKTELKFCYEDDWLQHVIFLLIGVPFSREGEIESVETRRRLHPLDTEYMNNYRVVITQTDQSR